MSRNILIDPQRTGSSNPNIQFSGSAASSIKLEVLPSGSVQFTGVSGSLLSIVDSLTGSLFAVSDISGLPILEVFSDDKLIAGTFNSNALVVSGTRVGIGAVPTGKGADVFFYVSGSAGNVALFGGDVYVSGTVRSSFTGSLTQLLSGVPFIVGSGSVTVTTSSNGQVVINGTAAAGSSSPGEVSASYVVLSATSSLANERVLTAGSNITFTDNGPGNTLVIAAGSGSGSVGPAGPTGGSYTLSFTSASLSSSVLTIPHGLGYQYVVVEIYDSGSYKVMPNNVLALNTLTASVDLSGFVPIAGTWNAVVTLGASAGVVGSSRTVSFTSSSLSASTYVFNHGLNAKYVLIDVFDSTDNKIIPDGIVMVDAAVANVELTTYVPISGTWHAVASLGSINSTGSYGLSFVSASLVGSGVLPVTHSLGAQYVNVNVYDDQNVFLVPDSIIADSANTLRVDLTSYAPITGTWHLSVIAYGGSTTVSQSITNTTSSIYNVVGGEVSASYLVLSSTASLANERVFTPGTGLTGSDAGPNGAYTLSVLNSVVATVSGTLFTGPVFASGGLTGSLQLVGPGLPYMVAGSNVTITTASNGQVTIASTASGPSSSGEVSASYLVLASTSSLANERVLTMGTGLTSSDGGAGNAFTLSVLNSVVATVSGTLFTGPVFASGGLTGSLQLVGPGLPYLLAGTGIQITTASNGQVTISDVETATSAGEVSASYVVLSATSSLASERVLTAGGGISITDNGPGNAVVISTTTTSGGIGGYSLTFTSSSLVGSQLAVTHSLGVMYPSVTVYDDTNSVVLPDYVTSVDASKLVIGFASQVASMTGSWHVFVSAGGIAPSYYTTPFTSASLVGSTLTVTHSLGQRFVLADVYDSIGSKVIPNFVRALDSSTVQLGLASLLPVTGTWTAAVMAGGTTYTQTYTTGTWRDAGNSFVSTGSVSVDSQNRIPAAASGADTYFFVSGTIGLSGSSAKKAVFGGDVVVSGSITSTSAIVANVDFTSLSNETITGDTTRTWGGVLWQIKGNSWSNQSLVVDSSGVSMVSTATNKVLQIHSAFSSSSGLLSSDNYRMWLYMSSSAAVGFNSVTAPYFYLGWRQWDGASFGNNMLAEINGWGGSCAVSVEGFDGFTDDTMLSNAVWASSDVIVFEKKGGSYKAMFGTYGSDFPAYTSLRSMIERPAQITAMNSTTTGWTESIMRVYLDIRNGNSNPYTQTLKRLKIERLP